MSTEQCPRGQAEYIINVGRPLSPSSRQRERYMHIYYMNKERESEQRIEVYILLIMEEQLHKLGDRRGSAVRPPAPFSHPDRGDRERGNREKASERQRERKMDKLTLLIMEEQLPRGQAGQCGSASSSPSTMLYTELIMQLLAILLF